jgi:ubiquinone/menaquinone biosynthesis C-methylase UbiE
VADLTGRDPAHDELTGAETEAERAERLRHGSSFGAIAASYAVHRPGYPDTAVRWVLEPVHGRRPLRVLDLAAGTGKLTTALIDSLAGLGAELTAVEPDQAMLAELRRTLPAVRSMSGTAEEIPLPDGSVDAVLAGQAMHWFDLDRAVPELARVLTPGGVLAGLWNADDDRVDWVARLAEFSKRQASITVRRWQEATGQDWRQRLTTGHGGEFGDPQVAEFENGQPQTIDSLVATMATHSHFLNLPETDRPGLLSRARELLNGQPETAAGEFVEPMVTVVVRAIRL